ncbi:MAG: ATP-dependent DNA helicase [Candidatus Liptonbacteria bacterium]
MMDGFQKAYKLLNPRQREAVDTIDGPVMVMAGPGTGKTQILTLRIANILLKTDTPPDAILALTFTEAGATNMRQRLVKLVGSAGYYVNISTFHGFCNRLILEYPEYYTRIIGSEHLAEVGQISYLREVLDKGKFEKLKPFNNPHHYVGDIVVAIKHLKNEGYSAEDFKKWAEKEMLKFGRISDLYHKKGVHRGKIKGNYQKLLSDIEKTMELANAYLKYEKILLARRRYDFDDMILETVQALTRDESFLLELQEKYHYFLVDEHQDTNSAQNRVLELLAGFYENPNLFVVGDEKQAIFRFQGASLENFLYFQNKYPKVRLISLEDNYRSSQSILDSAQSVIEKNNAILGKKLKACGRYPERKIKLAEFHSMGGETYFIANTIRKLLDRGAEPGEIAVIYRDNADGFRLADFFEKQGIAVNLESDQDILHDPDIKKLLSLLRAVSGFGNDTYLAEVLHVDFLELDPLDVYRLIHASEREEASLHRALKTGEIHIGKLNEPDKLRELYRKMEHWHRESHNKPFVEVFEAILRESGYLASLLGEKSWNRVEKLNTLFDEAKKMAGNKGDYSLGDFMGHLRILEEHGVAVRAKLRSVRRAVRLMTAHRAKGLEFGTVFIGGLTDGHWGNRRNMSKFRLPAGTRVDPGSLERNEDERRLFYVAMTRAREEVFLTYAKYSEEGRELVPSQFVSEIKPELLNVLDASGLDAEYESRKEIIFSEKKKREPGAENMEFVRGIFEEKGLSVTALNNYLECPWKYFYQNLLRLPAAETKYLMYGTAVHGALQRFFAARKENSKTDSRFLLKEYENELMRQPMPSAEREEMLKKGRKELRGYYESYHTSWNYNTLGEFSVRDIELAPGIKINGKLDKLELLDNQGEVRVVDYKTGQVRSRNEIEGKTASSGGEYKRQLVFYKLLLNVYPLRKYNMVAGVIDFIQPNERGKYKREEFVVTDKEVEDLRAQILRVADEIVNLKFWEKGCGKKDCEYCRLRKMMR